MFLRSALAARADWGTCFLRGHGLRGGESESCEADEVAGALGKDGGDSSAGSRQRRNGVVGFGEVEGSGHVADGGAAPGGEVGNFGTETSFEETKERGVVEEVRRNEATAREGRDDEHRHTEAKADGAIDGAFDGASRTGGAVRYSPGVPGGAVTGGT